MIDAICIIPTGDGCSAVCPVDSSYEFDLEASVDYEYDESGLVIIFNGLRVKIPSVLFGHLQGSTLNQDEELGWVTCLHLYGKADDYVANFITTLAIEAEEFVKAKGVAEYLSRNPRRSL